MTSWRNAQVSVTVLLAIVAFVCACLGALRAGVILLAVLEVIERL